MAMGGTGGNGFLAARVGVGSVTPLCICVRGLVIVLVTGAEVASCGGIGY